MNRRTRIVLADDHALVADMLARFLRQTCDVLAVMDDGRALVDAVARHQPDVAVADMAIPGMDGLAALRRVRADGFGTPFVFLTMHGDPGIAGQAVRAGASGYLLKSSAADELLTAIAEAQRGHLYVTPLIAGDVFGAIGPHTRSPADHRRAHRVRVSQRDRRGVRSFARVGEGSQRLSIPRPKGICPRRRVSTG